MAEDNKMHLPHLLNGMSTRLYSRFFSRNSFFSIPKFWRPNICDITTFSAKDYSIWSTFWREE